MTADREFERIVQAFAGAPDVIHAAGKGFGSGSLKVKGSIFAMISSRGQFVVKLPAARVTALVARGLGEAFDAGKARPMKEWLAMDGHSEQWLQLAREACQFVGSKR